MANAPARNRLPEPWRLGEEEFPGERRHTEERWASASFFELCEHTPDLPDAAVFSALTFEGYAKSYFELVSRIHADQRMERMESELRALADRVRELEGQAGKEATCSPFVGERAEAVEDGEDAIEGIEFRSTESFERDLQRLTDAERGRVIDAINSKARLLVVDPEGAAKEFARPFRILLHGGLESSLSEARVGRDLRVLLTVDEDPIFGLVILTLLRVVRRGEMKRAFDEALQLLYAEQVLDIQSPEK